MSTSLWCHYCVKRLDTDRQLRQHISATATCRSKWEDELTRSSSPLASPPGDQSPDPPVYNTSNSDTVDSYVIEPGELQVQYAFLSDGPPPLKKIRTQVEDREAITASSARLPKIQYRERYLPAAGSVYGSGNTMFETWNKEGISKWGPFRSREEWDLGKWLMKNIGHGNMNELLGLDIVSVQSIRWVKGGLLTCFR